MLPRFFVVVLERQNSPTNCRAKNVLPLKYLYVVNERFQVAFFIDVLPHGIFFPVGGVSHNVRR